jgi:hypothetical protein
MSIWALLLCTAAWAAVPAVGRAAVVIPAPSWMEQTAIADKMVINGLPSTVHYFLADRKLEVLLAFYRERWDESHVGRAGYREAAVAPWHIISRLEGRYLLTVQAREKDALTTEGFLAVADLQQIAHKSDGAKRIPKLAGSDVVNDLTSYDPGKKGRTLMIVNAFSVSRNSDYYRDYYLDRGWGLLQDHENNGSRVLSFRRSGKEAHIVINPARGGAVTVMNLVEAD